MNIHSVVVSHCQRHPEEVCIICKQDFLDQKHRVILGEKGSHSINLASERLHDGIHAEAGDFVHRTCRGQYTNQKAIEGKLKKTLNLKSPKKRRQPGSEDSKPKCLFCGKEEKDQNRGGKRSLVGQLKALQTVEFQETVLRICSSRGNSWARDVKGKIEFLQDCVAHDVVYHNACFSNFRSDCQIQRCFGAKSRQEKNHVLGGITIHDSPHLTVSSNTLILSKSLCETWLTLWLNI